MVYVGTVVFILKGKERIFYQFSIEHTINEKIKIKYDHPLCMLNKNSGNLNGPVKVKIHGKFFQEKCLLSTANYHIKFNFLYS